MFIYVFIKNIIILKLIFNKKTQIGESEFELNQF